MNGPKVGIAALEKSGYMLETPRIPRYCNCSDNATGADNQQERLLDVSRILRGHTPDNRQRLKRWSDLHGDMQGSSCSRDGRMTNASNAPPSEIPCRVSKNEPVPANIGEARTATCGCARVMPREVVQSHLD